MTHLTDSAHRSRATFDPFALERNDRLLLAGCAVAWLAALGAVVAATVALIDLGRGHADAAGGSETPWVLYVVIAVSAAVIVAAVPLLLRARRAAQQDAEPVAPEPVAEPHSGPAPGADAATEKLRVPASTAAAPVDRPAEVPVAAGRAASPATDQIWFRCATSLAGAMGVAVLLIGVSTYLMALGNDAVAWVLYGFAGVVTVAMAAIPWYFLRELGTALDS